MGEINQRKIYLLRYKDGKYRGNFRKKVSFEDARLFSSEAALQVHFKEVQEKEPFDILEFIVEEEVAYDSMGD